MNGEVEFNRWLLAVGNGSRLNNSDFDDSMVEIPFNIVSHENTIVSEIFGNSVAVNNDELNLLSSKVILTPNNTDSVKINHEVLFLLPGDEIVCRIIDSVCTDDEETVINYPSEFFNSLNPSGLPPHELKLKPGCIIMLLRNLNARRGLLNGTRLLVISLNAHFLHGKILSGSMKGE